VRVNAPRPDSAYTGKQHQAVARRGINLFEAKAQVMQAWAEAEEDPGALPAGLAARGMCLQAGDQSGVWLVLAGQPDDAAPLLIGALHRLLRRPKRLVEEHLLTPVQQRPGLSAKQPTPGAR
jgi:hypothetical protein